LPFSGLIIVFVLPENLVTASPACTFDPESQITSMKSNGQKQKAEPVNPDTTLEDVKKKLKKKELQTSILKKIIGQTDPSDVKPS
jgi:hypothetical protein